MSSPELESPIGGTWRLLEGRESPICGDPLFARPPLNKTARFSGLGRVHVEPLSSAGHPRRPRDGRRVNGRPEKEPRLRDVLSTRSARGARELIRNQDTRSQHGRVDPRRY